MPEMTVKYNKEELEKMLVDLLLQPQGLKLADVEKPIQWKYRPELKVIIHAEVDPNAIAAETPDTPASAPEEEPSDPLAETLDRKPPPSVDDLDPSAFPPGTNLAGLKDAVEAESKADERPLMPGESHERKKK